MTTLEMQYKAANERLEASLEALEKERADAREFLADFIRVLANPKIKRSKAAKILASEMVRQGIVW